MLGGMQDESSQPSSSTDPKDLRAEIEKLKQEVAVQAATTAGAQATQAATLAGSQATQAAATAGAQATQAAMNAGTLATVAAGFVALVVGVFLGATMQKA